MSLFNPAPTFPTQAPLINPQPGAGFMGGATSLLPNPSVNEQYSQNRIKQLISLIYECQTSQEIQYLFPFLINQQKEITQQTIDCSKSQGITQYDEQYLKSVKERCLKLKSNNEIILTEMFNIKEKFGKILSLNIDRNTEKQEQFNIVHDKIRRVKMDIVNKLQNLKTRRIFDQTFNKSKQSTSNRARFTPINIALTQLKDATEVIDRELIKQREEIKMLIKILYDETI